MKQLFVALMAVLVLASCGEKKEPQVTPADVMMMTVDAMNSATENFDKAATVDEVIDAMAGFYSEMKELQTNYGDIMTVVDTLSEEDLNEKYPVEMEAMQNAVEKYSVSIVSKMELMQNMTPEQEKRWLEIIESEL